MLLSSIGPTGRKLSRRSSLTARIESKSEQACLHSSNNRGPRCPVHHPVECWSGGKHRELLPQGELTNSGLTPLARDRCADHRSHIRAWPHCHRNPEVRLNGALYTY